jgi:hypothetical protein
MGHASQDLGNGFSPELHGAVRHEEVDRRVRIPNIKAWVQRPKRFRIIPNGPFNDAGLSRVPHPAGDSATDTAFVVE